MVCNNNNGVKSHAELFLSHCLHLPLSVCLYTFLVASISFIYYVLLFSVEMSCSVSIVLLFKLYYGSCLLVSIRAYYFVLIISPQLTLHEGYPCLDAVSVEIYRYVMSLIRQFIAASSH
jgi:hypothetical protein